MSVEDEIKRDFQCPYHKLSVNLFYSFGWINHLYQKNLKKFEITTHQFFILRILKGYYPESATVHDLQDCMPEKKSDTSRLVERLRAKGIVERVTDKTDRRKVKVKLTSEGFKLLESIEEEEISWIGKLKNLDEKEAGYLNKLLDKLRD